MADTFTVDNGSSDRPTLLFQDQAGSNSEPGGAAPSAPQGDHTTAPSGEMPTTGGEDSLASVDAGGHGIDATAGNAADIHIGLGDLGNVGDIGGLGNIVDIGHLVGSVPDISADVGGNGIDATVGNLVDAHVGLGNIGNVADLGNLGNIVDLGNLLGNSAPDISADVGNKGIDATVGDTTAHVGPGDVLGGTLGDTLAGTLGDTLGGTGDNLLGNTGGVPDISANVSGNGVDANVGDTTAHVGLGDTLTGAGDSLLGGLLGSGSESSTSYPADSSAAIAANVDAVGDHGLLGGVLPDTPVDSVSPNLDVHVSDASGGDLIHVTGI